MTTQIECLEPSEDNPFELYHLDSAIETCKRGIAISDPTMVCAAPDVCLFMFRQHACSWSMIRHDNIQH